MTNDRVYCENPKHLGQIHIPVYDVIQYVCKAEWAYEDHPMERRTAYGKPKHVNRNNDCEEYEPNWKVRIARELKRFALAIGMRCPKPTREYSRQINDAFHNRYCAKLEKRELVNGTVELTVARSEW
jgi:hypothetical protein